MKCCDRHYLFFLIFSFYPALSAAGPDLVLSLMCGWLPRLVPAEQCHLEFPSLPPHIMTYFPLAAGLHRLGLNLSDVQDEFLYIGGNRGRHANYFKLSCPDEPYPKHEDYCVCGQCIDENCYIRSPTSGRTRIVGNCCIKRYVSVEGRTCKKCGVRHKNRVIDFVMTAGLRRVAGRYVKNVQPRI